MGTREVSRQRLSRLKGSFPTSVGDVPLTEPYANFYGIVADLRQTERDYSDRAVTGENCAALLHLNGHNLVVNWNGTIEIRASRLPSLPKKVEGAD